MTGKSRAPARAARLARLPVGRNQLRRPSDRLEGFLLILLAATFLAAVAAAPYFGEWLYRYQRADATQLRAATAVLTESGPSNSYMTSIGAASARWRAPDGQARKGMLTTVNAPGISGAPDGARVLVWLTYSGQPQPPPLAAVDSAFASVVFTTVATAGAAIMLLACYWLGRLALDRRRLAKWTSEWSLTGPRWTTRRP